MSSISGVSSATNPYQTGVNQFVQDFQAIGSALQSGSLASAQSAVTTFQQYLQSSSSQSSSTQPFGKNSKANSDYQSLVGALQSGNLTSAQQAYSSLQTDLKSVKGHHHHQSSSTTTAATNNLTANLTQNQVAGIDGNSLDATA
jgi:hypothetical protein